MPKGGGCSISGKKYEFEVYNIVKKCKLNWNNIFNTFNTQNADDLGGCGSKNDIECVMGSMIIPIEIKKMKTPDWMQCSLKYDSVGQKWIGSEKNKIPERSKKIFEDLVSCAVLFNGKIPPFMLKDMTHQEWLECKKNTSDFNDFYLDCSNDTIKNLYSEKGCIYMQVSGKGLYHLGNDICNFGVPEFICEQEIRIRIKVNSKTDRNGHCRLTVMAACKPININKLEKSKFSLDKIKKLPKNLKYIKNNQ